MNLKLKPNSELLRGTENESTAFDQSDLSILTLLKETRLLTYSCKLKFSFNNQLKEVSMS